MARVAATGVQDFSKLIRKNCFYVDKTLFMKEWWENEDDITLITRPRRFGKTLTMDMVYRFFSIQGKKENADLFVGLDIWKEEKYRELQGGYPVIYLSFADIKEHNFDDAKKNICRLLSEEYDKHAFLLSYANLSENERATFHKKTPEMDDVEAKNALRQLSNYLSRYYGEKVIILLDEYDTPMQEAFLNGYWEEMSGFINGLLNATFKTNPYLERALLTGITRVGKESIFSDLNNLEAITVFSEKYAASFGFTENEVFEALMEYGLEQHFEDVKYWYDGFTFGSRANIYNPWSITQFLSKKEFKPYWANTSSNQLISELIKHSGSHVKQAMENLLQGEHIYMSFDEEVVFHQLKHSNGAIWSLMVSSGYLKVTDVIIDFMERQQYELDITNYEVLQMLRKMFIDWFYGDNYDIVGFCKYLLAGDIKNMQMALGKELITMISCFDTANENSYHMFVLGLVACLQPIYTIKSNLETGYGRCDTVLYPKNNSGDAIILEYKKVQKDSGQTLEGKVWEALQQIIEKRYIAELEAMGVAYNKIRIYGFAFKGKEVMIDGGYFTDIQGRLLGSNMEDGF